jgi:hypothetical protein
MDCAQDQYDEGEFEQWVLDQCEISSSIGEIALKRNLANQVSPEMFTIKASAKGLQLGQMVSFRTGPTSLKGQLLGG